MGEKHRPVYLMKAGLAPFVAWEEISRHSSRLKNVTKNWSFEGKKKEKSIVELLLLLLLVVVVVLKSFHTDTIIIATFI